MATNAGIRDFIYLDVERVRSFVAQQSGGLLSERTSGSQHNLGGALSGEGNIPFLAKAGAQADYHYLKSESETRSLHDYLFSEFYGSLEDADCYLTTVSPEPDAWQENKFIDGSLLIVPGVLKIVDYDYQAEFMKQIPLIYKTITKVTATGITSTAGKVVKSGHKGGSQQYPQSDPFHGQPLKEIADLVNQFYKGVIRLKVFPYSEAPNLLFVGSCDRASFRQDPISLMGQYGPIIDAGWTTVLQINKGTQHEPGALVVDTGNQIEDAFDKVAESVSGIASMAQGIHFPAVAVTPIAVFRDV